MMEEKSLVKVESNSLKEIGNYFKCDIKTIKRHANRLGLSTKNKNLERDSFGRFKRKINNK